MTFTAAITFKVDGGRKLVYSMAAGTGADVGFMIERFFKPQGLLVKCVGGFETQDEAQAEAERMFARAAQKHGRVAPETFGADNPIFQAAMEAGA